MEKKGTGMMETLYENGNLLTMDPEHPHAEALLVRGEHIVYVGNSRTAQGLMGPGTSRVDLAGDTLIPGFNDNHIHSVFAGRRYSSLDLSGLDLYQIIDALKDFYPQPRPRQLLEGANWDYPCCPRPDKSALDQAFPHNPVILSQYGGHGIWANSLGLRLMGIFHWSKDPPGGKIFRNEEGEPTGIVQEPKHIGMGLIRHALRYWGRRWAYEQLMVSLRLFRQVGITSVQDNTWFPPHVQALKALAEKGLLTSRFSCWHLGIVPLLDALMRFQQFRPPLYGRGPIKYFLDGTFSSRSAWLTQDYNDSLGSSGQGKNRQTILRWLRILNRRGRQGAFHAIGDRAVKTFLDALAILYKQHPEARKLRFRLEHAQLIREEDIPRIRDFGVLVASQPHALINPQKDITLLGKERAERAYPYRKLLDAGVPLSFGSDYPGEGSYSPLKGIRLAIERPDSQAISPYEALACYTKNAAYAEFQEKQKGMLKANYLADMVRLEKDLTKELPEEIENIRIIETILGGKCVYKNPLSAKRTLADKEKTVVS